MGDMSEYQRLMRREREGTSASFPPRPLITEPTPEEPAVEHFDAPLPGDEEAEDLALDIKMREWDQTIRNLGTNIGAMLSEAPGRIGRGAEGVYQVTDKAAEAALAYPPKVVADPLGEARRAGIMAAKAQQGLVDLGKAAATGDPEAIRTAADITSAIPGTGPIPELASAGGSLALAAGGKDVPENILWAGMSLATIPLWWLGSNTAKMAAKQVKRTGTPLINQSAGHAQKRQNVTDHQFADEYDAAMEKFRIQDEAMTAQIAKRKNLSPEQIAGAQRQVAEARRRWADDWTRRYDEATIKTRHGTQTPEAHRAEWEARKAAGEVTGEYTPPSSYGLQGMKEERVLQPQHEFGGQLTGAPGRRTATAHDVEERFVIDKLNTRNVSTRVLRREDLSPEILAQHPSLAGMSEADQIKNFGRILARDRLADQSVVFTGPEASRRLTSATTPEPPAILDDSGTVLAGHRDAVEYVPPRGEGGGYPDTEDMHLGLSGEVQATSKGKVVGKRSQRPSPEGRGVGTEGMSKSLVRDLSDVAEEMFPPRVTALKPERYFDELTAVQQKEVLEAARESPHLARALDAHKRLQAEKAAKAPTGTGRSTAESRARMTEAAKVRQGAEVEGLSRREAQQALKGTKRRAVGSTKILKGRVKREMAQKGLPVENFLKDVNDMTARFSKEEIKFIEQAVKSGDMAPAPSNLDLFEQFLGKVEVLYQPNIRQHILIEKTTRSPIMAKELKNAVVPYAPDVTRAALPTLGARPKKLPGLMPASEGKTYAKIMEEFQSGSVAGRHQPSVPVERVGVKPQAAKTAKAKADDLSRQANLEIKKSEAAEKKLKKSGKTSRTVRELYHSSPVEFKEFQISPRGKFLSGVYLSDASKASEYAGPKGLGIFGPGVGEEGVGYTYKVEVDTSDFLDWHQPITDSDYEVFSKAIDELGADGAAAVATHKASGFPNTLGGFLNSLRGGRGGQGSRAGDRYAKNVAQKAGYKGVEGTSGVADVARTADQAAEEIVVFDPADIKIISTTKVGEDVSDVAKPAPAAIAPDVSRRADVAEAAKERKAAQATTEAFPGHHRGPYRDYQSAGDFDRELEKIAQMREEIAQKTYDPNKGSVAVDLPQQAAWDRQANADRQADSIREKKLSAQADRVRRRKAEFLKLQAEAKESAAQAVQGKKKLSSQPEAGIVDESKRIKEPAGRARLFPTYEAYQEELRRLKIGSDELREMGMPTSKADFLTDQEAQILRYVEEPVQPLVRRLLSEGHQPYMSNAYGPGDKGVWYIEKPPLDVYRPTPKMRFVPYKDDIKWVDIDF